MPSTFPAELRIRKPAEFDRIYRARMFVADDVLVVNGDMNNLPHSRLGLSVSKRVGNAVTRNRWKRLIREVFRQSQNSLPAGLDLIIRPQKGAAPDFSSISKSLPSLARRLAKRLTRTKNPET